MDEILAKGSHLQLAKAIRSKMYGFNHWGEILELTALTDQNPNFVLVELLYYLSGWGNVIVRPREHDFVGEGSFDNQNSCVSVTEAII